MRRLIGQYSRYIRLKLMEDDGELAEALTGYPGGKRFGGGLFSGRAEAAVVFGTARGWGISGVSIAGPGAGPAGTLQEVSLHGDRGIFRLVLAFQ